MNPILQIGNKHLHGTKEICEQDSLTIAPKEGTTSRNETLFIVNLDNYIQKITIGTCKR